jgi:molybdate/tungstate transport system substrate-binding protein
MHGRTDAPAHGRTDARRARGWVGAAVLLLLGSGCGPRAEAGDLAGPLVVFNAGSLAAPFHDLLAEFARRHAGVRPRQESSGSLEAARKLTDLGRVPDVLGVADQSVIPALLVPTHATWHSPFARNAMVLVYTPRSAGVDRLTAGSWWRILLEPGVRIGRSDPGLDPAGYRALMVYQLAEQFHQEPGLAARLLAASPRRFVRAKGADLIGLLQAGELDYLWYYRTGAETAGLPYLVLPRELDLSDPSLAEWYAQARVTVPGAGMTSDSVVVRGEPIVFAVTIPVGAPHPIAAEAFVRFVFSPDGQTILRRHGFTVPDSLPDPIPSP